MNSSTSVWRSVWMLLNLLECVHRSALILCAVVISLWSGWASHTRLQPTWSLPSTLKTSAWRASTARHRTKPECNWSRLSFSITEVNVYRPLFNTSASSAFQDKTTTRWSYWVDILIIQYNGSLKNKLLMWICFTTRFYSEMVEQFVTSSRALMFRKKSFIFSRK